MTMTAFPRQEAVFWTWTEPGRYLALVSTTFSKMEMHIDITTKWSTAELYFEAICRLTQIVAIKTHGQLQN